jgi:histidinol-phosphate aminotransferase
VASTAEREEASLIFITSPNNPTGECLELGAIEELAANTQALVVVDQAYLEFAGAEYSAGALVKKYANVAVLRTFSKYYGLAGLRLGYLLAPEDVLTELHKVRQPYSVNSASAAAGLAVLQPAALEAYAALESAFESERASLIAGLKALGLEPYHTQANFVLVPVPNAHTVWERLYNEHGILVRDLSTQPGCKGCLRITVGTAAEETELLSALATILDKEA